MSRRKKTEEEYIKQFLATADVPTHRRTKADAQIPLVKGAE